MANNSAYIAFTNLADSATGLTASSQQLLLPISNIKLSPHVARKWRGANGATDYFVVDLGAGVSIDTFAVMGITGLQIRVRASLVDTGATTSLLYDSGTLAVDQAYLQTVIATSAITARYVRVDITNSGGSYVEAGRLFIGLRTQFSYNFTKGWQRQWNDRSLKTRTRGGQTQVNPDVTYRSIDVSFDFLTQSDRDGFVETIDRVNATKTDVLFVTNPLSANLARDSIWGLITTLTPVVQPSAGLFTKQYMIEERL